MGVHQQLQLQQMLSWVSVNSKLLLSLYGRFKKSLRYYVNDTFNPPLEEEEEAHNNNIDDINKIQTLKGMEKMA